MHNIDKFDKIFDLDVTGETVANIYMVLWYANII